MADVRLRRRILAEAWNRTPEPGRQPGPTGEERDVLGSLKRGRHAPWLQDTDPIPMLALAQLYRHDVPGLGGPADCDVLQVLWCPFDAHAGWHQPAVELRWRRSADVGEVLAEQPEPEVVGSDGYVPDSCVLHPEQVVEYPYFDLLPEELRERISAWEGDEDGIEEDTVTYQTDLSIAPGWKAGGFASWHVTDPASVICGCGRTMELLLTVASTEWDNGCRTWIPVEDLPTADAMFASKPTQVAVGRGGDMNIFVCPADAAHPHRLVFQG